MAYSALAGVGGLGLQATTAVAGLATSGPIIALGPGHAPDWPLEVPCPADVTWENLPLSNSSCFSRMIVGRFRAGRLVSERDERMGRLIAAHLRTAPPRLLYAFSQVALESLEWANASGIPSVLDNPNGHIRGFAEVYQREWFKWVGGKYRGHPTPKMVARVEREYNLAVRVRVSSNWAKASMVSRGINAEKIVVCAQPINRRRFHPPATKRPIEGPLRVCFVGSLDLRKGFVYLLRAIRAIGAHHFTTEFVGGTGDRGSKLLFARESRGLDVILSPGNPVPAYHRAELFVLPSLEDGFGFVAAEAMACGNPVVVTDQCGVAEWVRPGDSGWVVRAADIGELSIVLDRALSNRGRLSEMGREARRYIETRDPADTLRTFSEAISAGFNSLQFSQSIKPN